MVYLAGKPLHFKNLKCTWSEGEISTLMYSLGDMLASLPNVDCQTNPTHVSREYLNGTSKSSWVDIKSQTIEEKRSSGGGEGSDSESQYEGGTVCVAGGSKYDNLSEDGGSLSGGSSTSDDD